MMAVDIRAGEAFEAGTPHELFPIDQRSAETQYVVSRDCQRFLILSPVGGERTLPLTLVVNWTARLKQ